MDTPGEVQYWWHEAPVPAGLEITQVYGYLLCPVTGRVLVQDDDGAFNLPGGTPEKEDGGDLVATLVREAFEENQVRVGATAYLGYQEVHRPGRARYAQVRMAGIIEEFAPRAPDPDGGRIYRRLMTPLDAAPGVLGWGEPAVAQALAAAHVARQQWGLPVDAPASSGYADLGLPTAHGARRARKWQFVQLTHWPFRVTFSLVQGDQKTAAAQG